MAGERSPVPVEQIERLIAELEPDEQLQLIARVADRLRARSARPQPRESLYRVWVQFERQGTVNTVAFTVPVSRLK